jgi:hypothetical protein
MLRFAVAILGFADERASDSRRPCHNFSRWRRKRRAGNGAARIARLVECPGRTQPALWCSAQVDGGQEAGQHSGPDRAARPPDSFFSANFVHFMPKEFVEKNERDDQAKSGREIGPHMAADRLMPTSGCDKKEPRPDSTSRCGESRRPP